MVSKVGLLSRARRDYWAFAIRHEWPLLVTALGVALGAEMFLPTPIAAALSIVAIAIGIVSLIVEYRNFLQRWSAYDFAKSSEPFPLESLTVAEPYTAPVLHDFRPRATAISDDAIDEYLRKESVPATMRADPYELPALLHASAPKVLGETVRKGVVFNGSVLGLVDDPVVNQRNPVQLHEARFFDAQCSNELCGLDIRHRRTGKVFDARRELLLDSAGRLAPLAQTQLANVVGVSTVATTSDGYVVVLEQTSKNTASKSLLAPSGSGSLEPIDAVGLGEPLSLQELMANGMNRELTEECGITLAEIVGTEVVGYARWLERGGKPEFFGITELSITAAQLQARKVSAAERMFRGAVHCVSFDPAELAAQLRAGENVLTAPACPPLVRERGSLPLLLCLRAAALAA